MLQVVDHWPTQTWSCTHHDNVTYQQTNGALLSACVCHGNACMPDQRSVGVYMLFEHMLHSYLYRSHTATRPLRGLPSQCAYPEQTCCCIKTASSMIAAKLHKLTGNDEDLGIC